MRRRFGVLLVGAAVAALMVAMAGAAAAPSGSAAGNVKVHTTSAKAADAALDGALKGLVARHGGPPGVIAVVQRGKSREVHTFGVANLETDRRMSVNDRMRIASAAKAFSGAVALSLVSEGELSLNDTIGERLPALPDRWSGITLRQLLNHTSGLPDFSLDEGFKKALFASLKKAPPPEKLLTYIYDERLLFEPGSRYHYSNSDNIAVALMVREATGQSYRGQLQQQVYGPLGLKKTTLPAGPNLVAPYIHGYDNDPKEQPPEDYSEIVAAGWAWASGGIVSTPADMNDFIRGYVGGEPFDRRTQTKQRRVVEGGSSEPPGPGKNSAGLAVFRYETRCGTVWGHTGNTPGYTQFMAASPDGRRSVVVSINEQLTPKEGDPGAFDALRRAEERAVCAALAGR
ncbi:Beta-lactamase class C-like and penicillin binding proteins (PBPs) superfamily [uncultured Rubrobacteraceae bacterium]|uniref:Beta-lactamase class C-like and penicillin binding proteins (PBPs) superfamily n=1 Tax=uncultured Rubrobacteraceae bacterium TaxID=349277 RepID=A0A6J4Q1M8_9ACTN|nr:Beta-lactamase class C-like and penicillin binding proteins (PBPs) superfamily [uncultured Rubrobacteraceae bacterium]